ncbi:hypothetical protein ACVR1G_00230 [Streptococcus dentasini]
MNTSTNGLRTLAKANGLLGVIGGVIACICTGILTVYILMNGNDAEQLAKSGVVFLSFPTYIIRIAALVMGIIATVKFKANKNVPLAAHILFIVAFPAGFILGFFADLCIIIAGIIYLVSLKNFDQPQDPQQQASFPRQ